MNTANRYEQQELAIACGQMLRECAKFEPLARVVVQAEQLYDFFRYVEHPSFDVASDAFLTFKVLHLLLFSGPLHPVLATGCSMSSHDITTCLLIECFTSISALARAPTHSSSTYLCFLVYQYQTWNTSTCMHGLLESTSS